MACASAGPAARPAPSATPAAVSTTAPAPGPARTAVYGVDEALRDALSGQWRYVGTGPWPGINRAHACAFRNDRVLLVNVYCTTSEAQAFRIDVYSPTRGRVRIYAEAKGPISARSRGDYFTFTAESEPPPAIHMSMPHLSLTMSFDELRAYDDMRYRAYLPACFGGEEHLKKREGCLGALEPRAREWAEQNRAFLERANDNWYRLVREMRVEAARYGRELE
jgi:hypothetical protein